MVAGRARTQPAAAVEGPDSGRTAARDLPETDRNVRMSHMAGTTRRGTVTEQMCAAESFGFTWRNCARPSSNRSGRTSGTAVQRRNTNRRFRLGSPGGNAFRQGISEPSDSRCHLWHPGAGSVIPGTHTAAAYHLQMDCPQSPDISVEVIRMGQDSLARRPRHPITSPSAPDFRQSSAGREAGFGRLRSPAVCQQPPASGLGHDRDD